MHGHPFDYIVVIIENRCSAQIVLVFVAVYLMGVPASERIFYFTEILR